ncbi:hypothetical protein BJ912DRAFT_416988 [Pholiota molesta]|nr:hypothetical protein BJ912DRAFT_416988 [Pholiota molesta]
MSGYGMRGVALDDNGSACKVTSPAAGNPHAAFPPVTEKPLRHTAARRARNGNAALAFEEMGKAGDLRGWAWYQSRRARAYRPGRLVLAHERRCERIGSVSEQSPIDSTYQRGRRANGAVKVPMGERRPYCLGIWHQGSLTQARNRTAPAHRVQALSVAVSESRLQRRAPTYGLCIPDER